MPVYLSEREEIHFKNKLKNFILGNYDLKFINSISDSNFVEVRFYNKNSKNDKNFEHIIFIKSHLKDFFERDINDVIDYIFRNGISYLEKIFIFKYSDELIKKKLNDKDYVTELSCALLIRSLYRGKGNFNVFINKLKDGYKLSYISLKGEVIGNSNRNGINVYYWKLILNYKGKQLTRYIYLPVSFGNNVSQLYLSLSEVLKSIYRERLIYYHYNMGIKFNINLYRMDFGVSEEVALEDCKKFIKNNNKIENLLGEDVDWFDNYFNTLYDNYYNLKSKHEVKFK